MGVDPPLLFICSYSCHFCSYEIPSQRGELLVRKEWPSIRAYLTRLLTFDSVDHQLD